MSARRQLIGSHDVATEVVRLVREIVAGAKFSSFVQLTDHIEEVGKLLQDAGPKGESNGGLFGAFRGWRAAEGGRS